MLLSVGGHVPVDAVQSWAGQIVIAEVSGVGGHRRWKFSQIRLDLLGR